MSRGEGAGDKGSDEDEEVFDDTDFYQQLLRDVIESKGGGSGQLMASQRQKKSKKNVDTRASKGRKLRFVIFTMSVGDCLTGIQTGTKCTKRYRISWCQFLTMRGRGMKRKSTSCLRRCLGRDLRWHS